MSVICINPNLIVQAQDPLTTGVVYMPISLAYAASALRQEGVEVNVIDAYAQNPRQVRRQGKFWVYGLSHQQISERLPKDPSIIIVYAINLTNHLASVGIVGYLRQQCPKAKIAVLENTQAVTAYALKEVADEFYSSGADYILTGEPEQRIVEFVKLVQNRDFARLRQMQGVGGHDFYNPPQKYIEELDQLPYPAWDLFPLQQYWSLRFSHGPFYDERYLPLLTSRGCPYPCRFCVVPATNNQRWRARSFNNVVDEMEYFSRTMGVKEFHIEDLDPTISDQRIQDFCKEIIQRKLDVTWKIAAGTKVETIRSVETIDLMAQAGCRYISISPETGSPRLLKLMQKPFDLNHAVKLIARMNQNNIRSQACFVLGFPEETDQDRKMTLELVKDLTQKGVDEIAVFIITPVPGSAIAREFSGYESLSDLNFSPTWRQDYQLLTRFRLRLYKVFLSRKLFFYPFKIIRQSINFMRRRFETKMEMVPYRALMLRWWARKI